jgi:hypothetical protein
MKYNLILLLLALRTTHSLFALLNAQKKNEPRIIAPPQISNIKNIPPNSSFKSDNGSDIFVRNTITKPTRPPMQYVINLLI